MKKLIRLFKRSPASPQVPPAAFSNARKAAAYLRAAGARISSDAPDHDGSRRWIVDHVGWSHGGVSNAGLVAMANEHHAAQQAAGQGARRS